MIQKFPPPETFKIQRANLQLANLDPFMVEQRCNDVICFTVAQLIRVFSVAE